VPRVFEKGYTGYNGREQQRASGLGLYLCTIVAEKIGISLSLTSELGKGTKVMLDFPTEQNFNE
jgi:signal transduction histidine kinase